MRIAFFHGLESPPRSEKNDALEKMATHVYAPPMDYTDPRLFDQVLKEVREQGIELLVGSSMGGWFAHCLSTVTGIPALLFNPAVHSRSVDPSVKRGGASAKQIVVLGKADNVIEPRKTIEWFNDEGIRKVDFYWGSHGHRLPIDVFIKWVGFAIQNR